MKSLKKIIIISVYLVVLSSCTSKTFDEIAAKVPENPTYAKDIKPLIEVSCISCHGGSIGQAQYPPLNNYQQVKMAADATQGGQIICRMENACGLVMPLTGKLPQPKIDLVKKWAATGFTEQ